MYNVGKVWMVSKTNPWFKTLAVTLALAGLIGLSAVVEIPGGFNAQAKLEQLGPQVEAEFAPHLLRALPRRRGTEGDATTYHRLLWSELHKVGDLESLSADQGALEWRSKAMTTRFFQPYATAAEALGDDWSQYSRDWRVALEVCKDDPLVLQWAPYVLRLTADLRNTATLSLLRSAQELDQACLRRLQPVLRSGSAALQPLEELIELLPWLRSELPNPHRVAAVETTLTRARMLRRGQIAPFRSEPGASSPWSATQTHAAITALDEYEVHLRQTLEWPLNRNQRQRFASWIGHLQQQLGSANQVLEPPQWQSTWAQTRPTLLVLELQARLCQYYLENGRYPDQLRPVYDSARLHDPELPALLPLRGYRTDRQGRNYELRTNLDAVAAKLNRAPKRLTHAADTDGMAWPD
jgi:hypothetical protein